MTPDELTIAQLVQADAALTVLAAQIRQRANLVRVEIERRAVADYTTTGVAPTWRSDVATVSLRTARPGFDVTDPVRFAAWVAERYPSEVEPAVRPAFLTRLRETANTDLGLVIDTLPGGAGEIVPGLTVRKAGDPLGVSIRITPDARDLYSAAAPDALRRAAGSFGSALPYLDLPAQAAAELAASPDMDGDQA